MEKIWNTIAAHQNILILGFGREGQSTYSFIRRHDPSRTLTIADASEHVRIDPLLSNDKNIRIITGPEHLVGLEQYDIVIKAPGISLDAAHIDRIGSKLSSQAGLFLAAYRDQTIGITGTKGKSTVVSFVQYMLKTAGKHAVLLGNIGVPPFDVLSEITPDTTVVFELSSHMLQTVTTSPHIAVLLNIFPEHLDYYGTMDRYIAAKANIFRFQVAGDILITGDADSLVDGAVEKYGTKAYRITEHTEPTEAYPYVPRRKDDKTLFIQQGNKAVPFYALPDKIGITGAHVLRGLLLGAVAACYSFADAESASRALATFSGLSHRLENIGTWKGITFINDSISTIPEATIAALTAFPETSVLVVGGMDRGISYVSLVDEIQKRPELYVICLDETGRKIHGMLTSTEASGHDKYILVESLEEAVVLAYQILADMGGTVLLSPAAASYTQFKNFEERGKAFAEYAQRYGTR